MRFTTLAPAKVNLVLRVGELRPDGYHDLLTLLAPLDLADRVDVRVSPRKGPVACRVPGRPDLAGPSNLAARAAALFRERFHVANALAIRIAKRVPVTAGLGGGSSDAAAVLRILAHAFRLREPRDLWALAKIALAVGSDVPFFLREGAAWARGRGERLTPAKVPSLHLVLLHPSDPFLAIRAEEAYGFLDRARAEAHPAIPARSLPRRAGRFDGSSLTNDLQEPCIAHRPALGALLGRLEGRGKAAIMSGSGPTVFGLFRDRREALFAGRDLKTTLASVVPKVQVIVARTVERQPRVTRWRSPRSASSLSAMTSSRHT